MNLKILPQSKSTTEFSIILYCRAYLFGSHPCDVHDSLQKKRFVKLNKPFPLFALVKKKIQTYPLQLFTLFPPGDRENVWIYEMNSPSPNICAPSDFTRHPSTSLSLSCVGVYTHTLSLSFSVGCIITRRTLCTFELIRAYKMPLDWDVRRPRCLMNVAHSVERKRDSPFAM